MANGMYFGNRNYMQWIAAPQINYEASRKSKITTAQFTNGGAFVKKSSTGSRQYNFSWTMKPRDVIRPIMDYYDGVYGDGLIYFLDPFAMDKNVLPQYWATPSLAAGDAPLITGSEAADRPALVGTSANSLHYPSYSAVYSIVPNMAKPSLFIPIPPYYTLWVGVHGSATGDVGINIFPATGPTTNGPGTRLTMLPVTSTTRVNYSISGNDYPGAFLQASGSSGTMTLSGIIAQVLPWNQDPAPGGFISGQGNSGVRFFDDPVLTQYSAALDRVGLSAVLAETGAWE